jgi:hypothetical protein
VAPIRERKNVTESAEIYRKVYGNKTKEDLLAISIGNIMDRRHTVSRPLNMPFLQSIVLLYGLARWSSAFVLRPQPQQRSLSRLHYSQNQGEDEGLSAHEQVWHMDPEWYEHYVVRIMGKDYCDSKWPMDAERINAVREKECKNAEPTNSLSEDSENEHKAIAETDEAAEETHNTEKRTIVDESVLMSSDTDEDETTKQNEKITVSLSIDDADDPRRTIPPQLSKSETDDTAISSSASTPDGATENVTAASITLDTDERRSDVEDDTNGMEKMDLDLTKEAESVSDGDVEATAGSIPSVPDATTSPSASTDDHEAKDRSASKDGDSGLALAIDSSVDDDDVVAPKGMGSSLEEVEVNQEVNSEIVIRSTNTGIRETQPKDKSKDTVDKITSSNVTEASDPILLYRDMRNSLTMVTMTNLTKLGYSNAEVATLQSDALAVIVADEIPRPRMGVPPQWKKGKADSSDYPIMVQTLQEAEDLVQAELEEQRKQKRVDTESTRRRSTRDVEEDQRDKQQVSPMEFIEGPSGSEAEPRRRSRQDRDTMGRKDVEKPRRSSTRRSQGDTVLEESDVADRLSRRNERQEERQWQDSKRPPREERDRTRRRSSRGDGKSRRIYDARKPLNERSPPSARPDPPTPNYWPDMKTFRKLLRSEAELRLRILGDDWEETVKQESDWRLNLYKDWLWTLHNGVGEPIVPPSRYERARTTKIQPRRKDDGEVMSLSEPTRRSRRPPSRSRRSE